CSILIQSVEYFFSSRRRHTRSYGDWSSDVCSSDLLELPLRWKRPRRIFVNSMSDLFHENVPDDYIHQVFNTMVRAHWHTYQVLRSEERRVGKEGGCGMEMGLLANRFACYLHTSVWI